jgi:hypothetical protein
VSNRGWDHANEMASLRKITADGHWDFFVDLQLTSANER